MTSDAQSILHTFDALSDAEKRSLASAILLRSAVLDQPLLSDEQLTEAADEMFLQYDRQEGSDG